jgi:hypothetical protein
MQNAYNKNDSWFEGENGNTGDIIPPIVPYVVRMPKKVIKKVQTYLDTPDEGNGTRIIDEVQSEGESGVIRLHISMRSAGVQIGQVASRNVTKDYYLSHRTTYTSPAHSTSASSSLSPTPSTHALRSNPSDFLHAQDLPKSFKDVLGPQTNRLHGQTQPEGRTRGRDVVQGRRSRKGPRIIRSESGSARDPLGSIRDGQATQTKCS